MLMPAPRSRKPLLRRWKHLAYRGWRKLLVLDDTPHRVALGVFIGTFIGWLPIIGIQMYVAAPLAWIFRGNIVAAVALVWFSNPVTLVPCYWLEHVCGAPFLGKPIVTWAYIADVTHQVLQMSIWEGTKFLTYTSFYDLFLPMCVGGSILGIVTGIPLYFLSRKTVASYQHRRMLRRQQWLRTTASA